MAARKAVQDAPKLTGAGANGIHPFYGPGFFGLTFPSYMWIQNVGAKPYVQKSLAGKVIPMWIDDPTGKMQMDNPKAKTRITEAGRFQVLIFRRVAKMGQRKTVRKKIKGIEMTTTVPMSFPGAPGRIGLREAPRPWTTPGRLGGRIARGNVGIRWYFPGLMPRLYLNNALWTAANYYKVLGSIRVGYNFIGGQEAKVPE